MVIVKYRAAFVKREAAESGGVEPHPPLEGLRRRRSPERLTLEPSPVRSTGHRTRMNSSITTRWH